MSEKDFYVQNGLIRRLPVSDKNLTFEVGYVESVKYKMKKLDRIVVNTIRDTVRKMEAEKTNAETVQ